MSFGFAHEYYLLERTNFRQEFKNLSANQVHEIEKAATSCLNAIENVAALFEDRGTISRSEYSIFVKYVLKEIPYVKSLGWAPRVAGEEKAVWESAAQKDGFPVFRLVEKNSAGKLVAVQDRPEYFPIYYLEPIAGNERLLGLDLASDKQGENILKKVSSSGVMSVVPPITVLQGKKGVFFVVRPLFNNRLQPGVKSNPSVFLGVLLAAVSGPDLVQRIVGPRLLQQMGIVIWDKTVPTKPQPLYYKGISGADWNAIEEHSQKNRSDDIVFNYVISVGSRQWEVVMMPRSEWNFWEHPWPFIIFFGGLVVTLLGYYLFNKNRESEKELKNQKAALDYHAIVYKTDLQGKLTYVNDKFCEIAKYSRAELLGQSFEIIRSDHHNKEFFEDMWMTVRGGMLWVGQVCNRAKDGSVFWVEMTIVPFFNLRGIPQEYIAICTDITRNIENEKKIEAAMQMKADFISTVSHELRTPLASIKAALDVVLSGTAGSVSEAQNRFLSKAKANIDRLKRLIDEFLDLSKLESGMVELHQTPTDLVALINSVVEIQRAVAEKKGVNLRVQVEEPLPLVKCDADKISEVFINFVNNALKFTEHGEVVVGARLVLEERHVRCSVTDTGEGIAAEDLPKLFGKFQQLGDPARRKTGGTGLGLAICREIVSRHNGKIWVESEKGKGSSFIFTIPI